MWYLPAHATAIVLIANAATHYVPSKTDYVVRFNDCKFATGGRADLLLLRAAANAGHLRYFGVTQNYRIACPVRRVDTIVLTGKASLRDETRRDAAARLGVTRVLSPNDVTYTVRDCNRDVNVTSCSIGAYGAMLMRRAFPGVALYLCGFSFHKESPPTRWHQFDRERAFFSAFNHIC